MTGPSSTTNQQQKGETCVPEVMRHEDDVTYSAFGHVEPALFLLAVAADLLANGEAEDARDVLTERNGNWRFPAVANALKTVTHVYYRFDQLPEDDEHMALCAADAEGALPFTVVDVA